MKFFSLVALATIAIACTGPVWSQDSGQLEAVEVEVLPGWRTEAGTHMVGVLVRLAPGWKTYWRSPGEGGIPPEFDLAGSENLMSVHTHWPAPIVFEQDGFRSIGYKNEVLFPVEITPVNAGGDIVLSGSLDLGVCKDVCMPASISLSAALSDQVSPDPAIVAALAEVPDMIDATVVCSLEPIDDGMQMTARVPLDQAQGELAVIELDDRTVWISPSVTERHGTSLQATVDMVPPSGQPFAVDRSTVRLTVLSDGGAVEMRGCVSG